MNGRGCAGAGVDCGRGAAAGGGEPDATADWRIGTVDDGLGPGAGARAGIDPACTPGTGVLLRTGANDAVTGFPHDPQKRASFSS